MRLPSGIRVADERDRAFDAVGYTPTLSEGLSAKVSEGFRFTTTRMLLDGAAITAAEREAYGYSPTEEEGEASMFGFGQEISQANIREAKAKFLTPDEYRQSKYFREGVEWEEGYTEQRARILAENYDQRRYIDDIIQRRDRVAGVGERVLGFGASLLGSLPDPVNLVPFTSGLKAGSLVGKVGLGVAEGIGGTLLADALVLPDLKRQGEDVGMADLVADLVAGAVLGGAMGAFGHGVRKGLDALAERRRPHVDAAVREAARAMDAPHIEAVLRDAPEGFNDLLASRYWTGEAGGRAMTPEELIEAKYGSRFEITGQDRADLYAAMEKAIADVADGRDVDVTEVLRNSPIYEKLPPEARTMIDQGRFTTDPEVSAAERLAEQGPDDVPVEQVELDEVQRLRDEGLVDPEDDLRLAEAQEVEAKIDAAEEAGLSAIECIAGVING